MIDERIVLLITNELTDQISKEDYDVLKDWLQESEENVNYYHSYKEAYLNGKNEIKARNSEKVYEKLSAKLQFKGVIENSESYTKSKPKGSIRKMFRSWLGIAATFLIIITSSWIIYRTSGYYKHSLEESSLTELIVKSNPSGIKTLITLPDGSKVKLNSESHIEYFLDFKNGRTVKLVGEAFFDIVRDTLKPFDVEIGDLSIEVLGTSFNVEAFPYEEDIKVALVTGKLKIGKQEEFKMTTLKYLNPDEMIVFDHQSFEYHIKPFDHNITLGWKDGQLIFKEAGFDEVIKKLERWYGVEIKVAPNADMSGKYNGSYKNASLEVVLEGMGFTSDLNFRVEGKKVYLN